MAAQWAKIALNRMQKCSWALMSMACSMPTYTYDVFTSEPCDSCAIYCA